MITLYYYDNMYGIICWRLRWGSGCGYGDAGAGGWVVVCLNRSGKRKWID